VEIASQAGSPKKILFIALGDNEPGEQTGSVELRFIPYEKDARVIARYYQAADLYLHAAKADNFPNTILEALACGVPVIATAVGGIPEQITEGVTGFLTAPGDSTDMAHKITHLLNAPDVRLRMGQAAAADAKSRFNLDRQVTDYADWYADLLHRWPKQNA
jgi:glycosyltransferase involved in cell wall biosynthesis